MNKKDLSLLLRTFAVPVLVMVLGLILLVNPDSAAILLSKIISWVLIAFGVCFGLSALSGDTALRNGRIIKAVIGLFLGILIGVRPLLLAESIGRFIGIFLLIHGLRDVYPALKNHSKAAVSSVIATVVGVVLILVPITTSRMILSLCGLVILCVGIAMAVDQLKGYKRLEDPSEPNIIDADE